MVFAGAPECAIGFVRQPAHGAGGAESALATLGEGFWVRFGGLDWLCFAEATLGARPNAPVGFVLQNRIYEGHDPRASANRL